MKTAVMQSKQVLVLEDRPIPVPKGNEVQVKVDYTGVCGSDVHLFQHATCALGSIDEPMVLGHECAGVVSAVGPDVKTLKVGDRVAVEPGVPCWQCDFCKQGKYNLCPSVRFYAAYPTCDGCFCEYIVHPENMCYKLPDSVSTLEGALLEPLSVGIHAVRNSGVQAGQTVVILGAGCIGLMDLMCMKKAGASRIIVCDVLDNRLELARKLGATHTFNSRDESYIDEIKALTGGGADVVVDAAGIQKTIWQAGLLVKKGGTLLLMAYPPERQGTLPINALINAEVTIKTSFRYRNTYPQAIRMVEEGTPLKEIVSSVFSLDDIRDAFDKAINEKATVTKCVIKINPDAD